MYIASDGAVFFVGQSFSVLGNALFIDNTACFDGGALFIGGSTINISGYISFVENSVSNCDNVPMFIELVEFRPDFGLGDICYICCSRKLLYRW